MLNAEREKGQTLHEEISQALLELELDGFVVSSLNKNGQVVYTLTDKHYSAEAFDSGLNRVKRLN
jgi:DNA-binding PadR family transcriptional regulator